MTNKGNSDDRQWDVFRYVAGELNDQEESAFEQQLEVDQPLREQVAAMVGGLSHVREGLAKVRPASADSPTPSPLVRLLAIAAMLLIGGLSVYLVTGQGDSPAAEEAIALKWAESFDGAIDTELAEFTDDFEVDTELSDVAFEESDWILEAFTESEEG